MLSDYATFFGWFAVHGLALVMINLSTKFEFSISTHYKDMKGNRNIKNGMVWGS